MDTNNFERDRKRERERGKGVGEGEGEVVIAGYQSCRAVYMASYVAVNL